MKRLNFKISENNLKKMLKVVLAGFNIFIKIKEESK